MSVFGWSLPPGCHTLPGEELQYCEICGEDENNCICPECSVCGEAWGDPQCYELKPGGCGLAKNQDQIESHKKNTRLWEEQAIAEQRYAEEMINERTSPTH